MLFYNILFLYSFYYSSGNEDEFKVVVRTLEQNQYQAIAKIKPKDPGQFEFHCSARNPHGYDMKKITLTVIGMFKECFIRNFLKSKN